MLLGLTAGLALSGCSSGAESAAADDNRENVGSLALQLQVGAVTLTKVSYTILGNGFAEIDYVLDVTNSTSLQAIIGGIPAGADYTLTLRAVDTKTGAICSGGTVFDVAAGETTTAPIHLTCRLPPTTGSLEINGTVDICPRVDALSVTPSQTTVGHVVTATASVTDVDQGPRPLRYHYSTSSGSFTSSADGPTATLRCTAPGSMVVTLTASDGDCTDFATETVTCVSTCGDGYLSLADGEACDDGNLQSGDGCSATCQPEDDPNTPGDDRAGYVRCGYGYGPDLRCGPGTYCCAGNAGNGPDTFCAKNASECPNGMASQSCDGPEDCMPNSVCAQYKATSCAPKVNTGFFYDLKCHVDADCPQSKPCSASGTCPAISG